LAWEKTAAKEISVGCCNYCYKPSCTQHHWYVLSSYWRLIKKIKVSTIYSIFHWNSML